MSLRVSAAAALFALTALGVGCGTGQSGGEGPAGGSAPEAPPPLPGESTVTGKITFTGAAPTARVIPTSSDPRCMPGGGTLHSEVLVVGPGNELQNVFVYVKDGLGDRAFQAPKTPVVLDQVGCRYTPHVAGAQVGQPVEIVNSDATLHNVHAVAKTNKEFNFSQPIKGDRRVRTFDKPEIMVPIKCEVHGWMRSYVGVVPHPFFAVSRPDGTFEIKGLPAGTFTIEAWHEELGTRTQKVTVDGKGSAAADFAFAAKT